MSIHIWHASKIQLLAARNSLEAGEPSFSPLKPFLFISVQITRQSLIDNVRFICLAQQALIQVTLSTTIIGRCIPSLGNVFQSDILFSR